MEPSPAARRWPARPGRDADSQPGRMIQEHPGQIELLRDVLRQRLHANCLCCVVTSVENVDPEFFGVEERPVLSFARDERIESGRRGLRYQRPSRTRDDPDPLHELRPEGEESRRSTEGLGERPTQLFASAGVLAPDARGRSVIGSEIAANLYAEQSREHAVVANVGMAVERKVSGVERDVSFDETRKPAIGGTDEWPQATPKHAVMDQETVGVLLGRLSDRGLAEVYGRGEPADVPSVADL